MKKITFLFALIFVATTLSAQVKDGYSSEAGRKTTFIKNGFWDNWFIGAGAGANIYFGDDDVNADIQDRITVAPSFQIGTWFSPYLGARLKTTGITNLHTFNNDANVMTRNKYISTEVNIMWDVTNYLLNYNANRVYSFIPYAGAGWTYGWDYKNLAEGMSDPNHVHSATVDVGIINRFRFSNRLSLDIEFSGKLLKDRFDARTHSNTDYDVLGTASASLVYNLGSKATFSEAVLRDQSEIDNLNRTINSQRAEITALNNRPATIVKTEPEVVVKEVVKVVDKSKEPVNNVVLFAISKTKVEPHQEVNVYNVAKYLQDNPTAKVRIVGYTDKATGTAAINERLSRERAQNVADLMTGKYNISKDRVVVDWEGQTNPPFSVDAWNRAVIMYME